MKTHSMKKKTGPAAQAGSRKATAGRKPRGGGGPAVREGKEQPAPAALSSPGEPAKEREARARRVRERMEVLLNAAREGKLNLGKEASAALSEPDGFNRLALQCTDDEWSGMLLQGHRVPLHLTGRGVRGAQAVRAALEKAECLPGDPAETRAPDGVPGCFAALRAAWERLVEEMPRASVRVLTERHAAKMPPHLTVALRWLGDVDGMQFDLKTWSELERHAANGGRTVAHYMAGVLYDHVRYRAGNGGRWSLPPSYRPEAVGTLAISKAAFDKLGRHAIEEHGYWGRKYPAMEYLSALVERLAEGLETSVDLNGLSDAEEMGALATAAGMSVREYLKAMIRQHLSRPGGKIRILPKKPARQWTLKRSPKPRRASDPAAA
jgi:hypothetical protein